MSDDSRRLEKEANKRVAGATSSELAFYIQEMGLCQDFVKWYDEMPPVQRLLARSSDARRVNDCLQEGKKRGYDAAFVASALDEASDAAKNP